MSQHATAGKMDAAALHEYVAEMASTLGDNRATRPADGAGTAAGSGNGPEAAGAGNRNLDMVMRIPVTVKIVLGSATMPVAHLVNLARGAIIPLDRRVGEAVDVVVNGRVIARGEVVVVDETTLRFGISLTEIVGPNGSDKSA